jgi:(4S)-4-hydroxy-5-phosphonooxypentane-2,3-dione isomerase
MQVVQVHIHINEDYIEAFTAATIENAKNSVLEPGIARFDVLRQQDEPTRFLLIEVYRDNNAPGLHKETAHYAKWRDTVTDMMDEPRHSIKYENVFPRDEDW